MKKIFHYFVLAFITVLLGSQLFLYADSAGILVKPTHVQIDKTIGYNPTYAALNFYTTSNPTFINLSTTSPQILKPFSTKTTFGNISCSAVDGKVTFKESGTYKVVMRMSIRATEKSTIHFQSVKNENIIINKTFKKLGMGDHSPPVMMNISTTGSGATADIISPSSSSAFATLFTNVTSNAKGADAVAAADEKFFMINEGSTGAVKGFLARARFDNVNIPSRVKLSNSGYDGANHHVKVRVFNAVMGRYTAMTDNGSDYSDVGSLPSGTAPLWEKKFNVPHPHLDYINSQNQVKVILDHTDSGTATHNFMLDLIEVEECMEAYYVEHTEIASFVANDTIHLRIFSDTPATNFYRYVTGLKIDKIGN